MKNSIYITCACILFCIGCTQYTDDSPPATDINQQSAAYMWVNEQKVTIYPTETSYKVYRAISETERINKSQKYELWTPLGSEQDPLLYGVFVTSPEMETELSATDTEIYTIPVFQTTDGERVAFSERITVILKSESDYTKLEKLAAYFNVTIAEKSIYLENWYNLLCTNESKGNSLEIGNKLKETNLFLDAFPGPILKFTPYSSDPLYNQQWGLNNEGQVVSTQTKQYNATPNIDIGYDAVKNLIPTTSDVKVAVIDIGVANHNELNIISFWDAFSKSAIKTIHEDGIRGSHHGTYCAGIIGAKRNNNLGIIGIAPAKIMSISLKFNTTTTNIYEDACHAFKHAIDNGADVISCSWGGSITNCQTGLNHQINRAFTEGRNGKGCVIAFAAGNNNLDAIPYPANCDSRILCVGAITPNGERATPINTNTQYSSNFGSNFGTHLDIMAPGVGILSTNASNSFYQFSGTSAACPFVSGVAAALLSIDPSLTQMEINDAIETTARKIGSGYSQYSNRPNGSWSAEYGYGLIQIDEAIAYTFPNKIISDITINQNTTCRGNNLQLINVDITDGAEVNINSVFQSTYISDMNISDISEVNISAHTSISMSDTSLSDSHLTAQSNLSTSFNSLTLSNSNLTSTSNYATNIEDLTLSNNSSITLSASEFTLNLGMDIHQGSELLLTLN